MCIRDRKRNIRIKPIDIFNPLWVEDALSRVACKLVNKEMRIHQQEQSLYLETQNLTGDDAFPFPVFSKGMM